MPFSILTSHTLGMIMGGMMCIFLASTLSWLNPRAGVVVEIQLHQIGWVIDPLQRVESSYRLTDEPTAISVVDKYAENVHENAMRHDCVF